jgi:hypothetical protein
LILGLILWVIRYAVGALGLPPIITTVATVIVAVVAILWLVQVLLGGVGGLDLPLRTLR